MTRLDAIRQRVERAPEHLSGIVGEDSIAVMVGEDKGAFVIPMGLADYAALALHANRDIPALLAVVEAAKELVTHVQPGVIVKVAGRSDLGIPPVEGVGFYTAPTAQTEALRAILAQLLQEVEG